MFLRKANNLLSFALIFLFVNCTTDDVGTDTDGPTQNGFPVVTTRTVVTFDDGRRVESGGEVRNSGGSNVVRRGVCWSTEPNPTIEDSFTSDGSGEGEFTSLVQGLEPNTRYYLRSYATNGLGTGYGGEVDFFTGKIIRQDVFLTSQEEVNAFGNENYLTIIGNLSIGSTQGSDITDLSPLLGLNQVRGELVIGGSARFGDGFIRLSNPLLENLNGLDSLAFIGPFFLNDFDNKALRIEQNEVLTNISALNGLGLFEGDLIISGNPNLQSLDGLGRLTRVERLSISSNDALTNLNGLTNLNQVDGSIILTGNENLEDVEVLNDISGRVATFVFNGNPLLDNVDFMASITEVQGNLILKNSPMLTDISGLNGIQSVGGFLEINNTGLTEIDNLNSISSIGQYLVIRDNQNLETLTGLSGLEMVDESLEIIDNNALISFDAFANLEFVGERITRNADGSILFTTGLSVARNDQLEILDGFENLREVEGRFGFNGEALRDVIGFENLQTVGGRFSFSFVNQLTEITGFGSLTSIGGTLNIQQNQQIQNLNFLSSLQSIGEDISIFINGELTDFCGLQVVAQSGFSGEVSINSNAFNPTLEEIASGNCSN